MKCCRQPALRRLDRVRPLTPLTSDANLFGKGCYQRGPRFLPAALSVSRSPVAGEPNPVPPHPTQVFDFYPLRVSMKIRDYS